MFFQSIFTELFDELFLLIRVARVWFSSAFTSIVFDQSIMKGKYDFQNGLPVGILPAVRVSKTFTSYFQWLRTMNWACSTSSVYDQIRAFTESSRILFSHFYFSKCTTTFLKEKTSISKIDIGLRSKFSYVLI